MLTILWSFSIWSKLEKWKTSINKCLMSLPKIKSSFWNVIFSYCMQQQQIIHFSIRLWHMTKSRFYMQLGDDQLCSWTEKRLQRPSQSQKLPPKKGHGHCLVVCCLSEPLQLSKSRRNITSEKYAQQIEMHWKLTRMQWALVNNMGPTLHKNTWLHTSHNQCFESWMNWVTKLCLIHHIHLTSCQPTTTSWSISTTFCKENASTTIRQQKMLSKVLWIPKHKFLCYRNKQTYSS